MKIDSHGNPAGNTANSIIANQYQEAVNVVSEIPAVTEQAMELKASKISKSSDQTNVLKIMENKDGKKTTAAKKRAGKSKVRKRLKNKDRKQKLSKAEMEVLTALYLMNEPDVATPADIMKFMILQHIHHGSFPAFFDEDMGEESVHVNVKDVVNQGIFTKPDGKYKRAEKEVLTAIRHLNDPNGSSLADIKKFIASQHKDGNLGGKSVHLIVKDALNRGILTKLDGKYKIAEKRKARKRSVSVNPMRRSGSKNKVKESTSSRITPKQ